MKAEQQYYSAMKAKQYHVTENGKPVAKPLETILQRGEQSLIGKKIIDYNFSHGDFGGSGAGFFGIKFEQSHEWMIVMFAGAAFSHCLLDGRWIAAAHTDISFFHPKESPWFIYGYGLKIDKDDFTPFITGAVIKSIELNNSTVKIILEKSGEEHLLEILDTDPRLRPYPGPYIDKKKIELPKALVPGEKIGDYIVFMEEKGSILLYAQK